MKRNTRLLLLAGIVIFGAGMLTGAQWFRLYLFPLPQLHALIRPPEERVPKSEKIIVTSYTAEIPVFLDRQYFDTIGDERLEGLFLVQIPRHHTAFVHIETYEPVTVYRFISDDNDNAPFDSWTPSDIPINVRGFSTTHTRVVEKEFPPGKITLVPGGPVASSPIVIEVHDYTAPSLGFKVLDGTMSTE